MAALAAEQQAPRVRAAGASRLQQPQQQAALRRTCAGALGYGGQPGCVLGIALHALGQNALTHMRSDEQAGACGLLTK